MTPRNAAYFDMTTGLGRETYLRARGWKDRTASLRSGGLRRPEKVVLGEGTLLMRLFHLKERQYGEWWSTPQEMHAVLSHFGIGNAAVAEGRTEGHGLLHAVFVVRRDWGQAEERKPETFDRRHLGRLMVVRLREPLHAYHGEGDVAPGEGQQDVQKAARILDADGTQRDARQVFLPMPWTYEGAFAELGVHDTDTHLEGAVAKYRRGPLYFEH